MDETSNTQNSAPAQSGGQEKKSNNTKWIIIAVVAFVVLYAAQSFLSPERAVERMIEQSTGGDVDIDVKKDGSVEYTSDDGENVRVSAGENVSLPNNWPSSVPVASDAKISYAGSVSNGDSGNGISVMYTTGGSVADVVAYYTSELTAKGWTIDGTFTTGDGSMLSASKGENENVAVYIGSSDGQTSVNLTVQMPK